MSLPLHLLKLIESFKKLPGVGAKTAERFAFDLLKWQPSEIEKFATLLQETPSKLKTCSVCGSLKEELCPFCSTSRLEPHKLCVLASSKDAFALEATKEFKGYYHILGGLISPLDGIGPEVLHLTPLFKRIEELRIEEIVIALDSTVEGDATALYLKRLLEPLFIPITRLAFGLPMGSSLDYVDGGTLARAFAGRSGF